MQLINVDIVCRSGRRYNFDITPETTMPYGIWSRYTYVPPCRQDDEAEVRAQIMVLRFLRWAEDTYKKSCKKRGASKQVVTDPFAGTDYEDLPDFCDGVFNQLALCGDFFHEVVKQCDRLAKYGVGADDLKGVKGSKGYPYQQDVRANRCELRGA